MPSHTWNEIGRWGDSVRANLMAWHSDLKSEIDEGFAIYPSHNLHMLLFAASMDGQGGIAIQAGKDYAKLTNDNLLLLLTLVRFGRFDEVLELDERPSGPRSEMSAGVWDFAHGYAQLRQGEPEFAKAHLKRLQGLIGAEGQFRRHSTCDLLGALAWILKGEIRRDTGDLDGAIRALRMANVTYRGLEYDEPEPLPFAAGHWLGAVLLEAERYEEAEEVYRQELGDHPHNGWSLFGLRQALAAQGKSDPAVDADFEASWARSDTWIRGSRF